MAEEYLLTYNKDVIKSPYVWTLWDYVSPQGNNKIEEWLLNDLSINARLMFLSLVKNIAKIENHLNWTPFRRFIKKHRERIWELGFRADGRQYRVLGDFCGEKQAVFLLGCFHKNHRYSPEDAIDQAFYRRGYLKNGTASHGKRELPTN